MRFRLGLVVGFGVGYYFGAKAGRTRYLQLREWINNAKESGVVETATEKAKAVVDLGVERARELLDHEEDRQETLDLTNGASYSPSR
jgi:hypothetical protein